MMVDSFVGIVKHYSIFDAVNLLPPGVEQNLRQPDRRRTREADLAIGIEDRGIQNQPALFR